ncbi:MAG: RES family NAD+ phosphorylase [Candidatus Thiodiazotropha sp. (ex Dulcina madagascariensis)]|nr:RES family NAD+ phosphorylase [Candidatus Thiodiazotropha sp. (ex Dulcina madagascariensis)]
MSDIWNTIGGRGVIQSIGGDGFRLVECQETVATTKIVSTLESQSILEEMLDEESKPRICDGTEHLHYLLFTSFRYPPMPYGSRFGGRFEPSLFYGGTSEYVTLCESAFYRFFFYYDMEEAPRHNALQSQHTLFGFQYQTNVGVKLQDSPFYAYDEVLRDLVNYTTTQALGTAMREHGVKGFEYCSARDRDGGINVALYDASPLTSTQPQNKRSCLCQVDRQEVVFSIEREITRFTLEQFEINGSLPRPAS